MDPRSGAGPNVTTRPGPSSVVPKISTKIATRTTAISVPMSAPTSVTASSDGATIGQSTAAATTPEEGVFMSPRKRKMEDDEGMPEGLFWEGIVVKPHPPNPSLKPRILQPVMVLPRAHLGLAPLDLGAPTAAELPVVVAGPAGRPRVEAHVRILDDLEHRLGEPAVLIARSDATGAVFALDRCEGSVYAACRLGGWVVLDELRAKAVACAPVEGKSVYQGVEESAAMQRAQKKKKVVEEFQLSVKKSARSQSVMEKERVDEEAQSQSQEQQSQEPTQDKTPDQAKEQQADEKTQDQAQDETQDETQVQTPDQIPSKTKDTTDPPQIPTDMLQNIRTQYLDTLYKSMGSLAYFAKGPLSRARAAYQLDDEAALDMKDLVAFLQSLVLTTVQIDTKYRETIPALVGQMKATTYVDSSDEGRRARAKSGRKPKKMRVARNGLYPGEDELARAWWTAASKPVVEGEEDDEGKSAGAMAQQIRSMTSLLRTRETQLQMMLILEILALEPACCVGGDVPLPGSTTIVTSTAATTTATAMITTTTMATATATTTTMTTTPSDAPPRKRNKNLPVLVDLHADRLCIWQSTATEEPALGADGQAASAEPLRDFCVDIIIPFFSARLPGVCKSINRKLGGPKMVSDKAKRPSASARRDPKPGAATKRPMRPAARPAHNLERALSKEMLTRRSESRGPPTALELMRSATATAVIPSFKREKNEEMKREMGESQLLGMAPQRPERKPRGATKAASREQVQEAISGIRKPNRQQAGRAIVEAAERRVAGLAKSKTPATVVAATPANVRFKNVFARADSQSLVGRGGDLENAKPFDSDQIIPPSSAGRVPDSITRLSFERVPDSDAVLATPSAPRQRLAPIPDDEDEVPASSPLVMRVFGGLDPRVLGGEGGKSVRRPLMHVANRSIFETPTKGGGGLRSKLYESGDTRTKLGDVRLRLGESGDLRTKLHESGDTRTKLGESGGTRTNIETGKGKEKSVVGSSLLQRMGWDDDDD